MKIYALIGSSMQEIGGTMPDGWLEMDEQRPSPEHVAQAGGTWALPETTLAELKKQMLARLEQAAAQAYVGGFCSTATGEQVFFDSTEDDQRTFTIMYNAAQSPDFASDPNYQGFIPVRGVPAGETQKQTFYLNKEQFQKLMDDLACHFGAVKIKHWQLQEKVKRTRSKKKLDSIKWNES